MIRARKCPANTNILSQRPNIFHFTFAFTFVSLNIFFSNFSYAQRPYVVSQVQASAQASAQAAAQASVVAPSVPAASSASAAVVGGSAIANSPNGSTITTSPAAVVGILTFKEWKLEKVQTSIQKMSNLRAQIQVLKMETGGKDILPLERQLAQESWNLEVIKELGISDYFTLYVKPIKNSSKYKQLAERLSSDELVELMESFSKNLGSIDEKISERPSTTLVNPARLSLENGRNKL